jgi:cytochrome c-type biogenesis protein
MDLMPIIADANFLVSALVALAAGIVSFASPCVVPLVPGYLSYMTGLSGAELAGGGKGRLRVLSGGILFVLGFTVPFALIGFFGATLAPALSSRPWQIVLGTLVALLGMTMTGLLPFAFLRREARVTDTAIDKGVLGALPLGFVFGVSWTPCIGPALAAILTLSANASTDGEAIRGGLLATIYALGLGLPFIGFGLLYHRASGALGFLRRNSRTFQIVGGVMLTLVGVAIATGLWDQFIFFLRPLIQGFEPPL